MTLDVPLTVAVVVLPAHDALGEEEGRGRHLQHEGEGQQHDQEVPRPRRRQLQRVPQLVHGGQHVGDVHRVLGTIYYEDPYQLYVSR